MDTTASEIQRLIDLLRQKIQHYAEISEIVKDGFEYAGLTYDEVRSKRGLRSEDEMERKIDTIERARKELHDLKNGGLQYNEQYPFHDDDGNPVAIDATHDEHDLVDLKEYIKDLLKLRDDDVFLGPELVGDKRSAGGDDGPPSKKARYRLDRSTVRVSLITAVTSDDNIIII
eukprot:scaffold8828_cov204-Amphora_coffeaeformis.AAC.18